MPLQFRQVFFCFLRKCFVVPFFFRQHNRPLSCRIVTDVSSPFSAVTSLFRQGGDRFAPPESENGSNEVGGLRENMKDVAIVRASVSFPCGSPRPTLSSYSAVRSAEPCGGWITFGQTFCVERLIRPDMCTPSRRLLPTRFCPNAGNMFFNFSGAGNGKVVLVML